MIYGLYLSASGVLTNSMRQDVIANNIANSETVGFKRDMATVRQRLTEQQERGGIGLSSDLLEHLSGGLLPQPTWVDQTQGELDPTGNNLDVAMQGSGYLGVSHNGKTSLTRNGQMLVNRDGFLCLSNDIGQAVLDEKQTPIKLDPTLPVTINKDGAISQGNKVVATIGVFDVADESQLVKQGGTLMGVPANVQLKSGSALLRSGFTERSNVDSATELAALMDTQRELEANANMIHIQDETLDKLVNDVGKPS